LTLNSYSVEWQGASLELLSERAVFWPEQNTLLVADVHLGKEHVFGRQGIAIPGGTSESTLTRLAKLLVATQAKRCIVLGDFFHDTPRASESWLRTLSKFLDDFPTVRVEVVAGNHDKESGQAMIDARVRWHKDSIQLGPFVLQHEPSSAKEANAHVIAGHLHPTIGLNPRFSRGLSGPCFWHQPHCTVLPAFGEFTGGHRVVPTANQNRATTTQ